MCGCCGCAQVDFCFGNLMYIFEKLAACCAMSAIVSCIIVTVMVSIGLGVGIGYNYSFIDMKTTKVQGESEYAAGDHRPLVKLRTDESVKDSNNQPDRGATSYQVISTIPTLRTAVNLHRSLAPPGVNISLPSSSAYAPPHDVPPTPPNLENDTNIMTSHPDLKYYHTALPMNPHRKPAAVILTLPGARFGSEKHTNIQPPIPHQNINKETPKMPATRNNNRRLPYLSRRVWEGKQKELKRVDSIAPRHKVKAKFEENDDFYRETEDKSVDAVFHLNEKKQGIAEASQERKYLNTRRNPEQGKQNKTKATTVMPTILIPMKAYSSYFPLISKILAQNKNVTLQFVAI